MGEKYGPDRVSLTIVPTYRNMKEVIDRYPFLIDNLTKAIRLAGLTPRSVPFRGGTDGSALSHRGLPCPNLSAGYENAHGRFEYVPIRSMEKNVEILLHLAGLFGAMEA
jgi:tripeptide aminopeptidase